ncbi:MAG: DUF3108 domain-containing protein [Candidatus Latescibacteria bacterium]|nr:DUF3108 domain-containing protein [bacterium]MBD3423349.1 DUF3108 domain-containing protein [Candidatus Latescibacterota bacterium]
MTLQDLIRKRRISLTAAALLAVALLTIAGAPAVGEQESNVEDFKIVKPLPDTVYFGVGEKLIYAIQYGLIYAGDATLEIRNIAVLDSVKSYHVVSLARTNRAFDLIYKVRDHHESFIDYDNLYSIRFEKHLREGSFRRDEVVTFDQKRHLAIYQDKEVGIPPMTQDFLSALYYVRTVDLVKGEAVYLANHTGGKNYPIYVKVTGYDTVEVPAGEFDCIVIEPVLKTSSIFKHEGKLTIWLTDDNVKMPVLLRSKVVVGSFEARLKEYTLSSDEPRVPLISREARNVR